MSKLSFLSWNIENLGPKKVLESNGQIFNFISLVALHSKADVIGLMEMPKSNPAKIQRGIIHALNANTEGDWLGEILYPGQKETYFILWRTDRGFKKIDSGITEIDQNKNELKFPTSSGKVGGRPAAYCVFKNDTNNSYFNYVSFHAPGPGGVFTPVGGNALSKAWPLYKTNTAKKPVEAKNVIVGGDFNIVWNDKTKALLPIPPPPVQKTASSTHASGRPVRNTTSKPEVTFVEKSRHDICYGSLLDKDGPNLTARIKISPTTLKNDIPGNKLNSLKDCLGKSYDHFFEKGLKTIDDKVLPVLTWLSNGTFKSIIETYKNEVAVNSTNLNGEVPPHQWTDRLTKKDAWLFYRRLVSDHLPISLIGTVK